MSTKITETKPLLDRTILIVEDDHFISKIYSKWLTAAGAAVVTANDGVQCLDILDNQKVDVVLLDLGMPGLNGYETLALMRQKPKLADLPVIVLSNTTMKENEEGFNLIKNAGVKDILRKYETSLAEILECITSYFPQHTTVQHQNI
jgi:CheY-like chemotaxis protein